MLCRIDTSKIPNSSAPDSWPANSIWSRSCVIPGTNPRMPTSRNVAPTTAAIRRASASRAGSAPTAVPRTDPGTSVWAPYSYSYSLRDIGITSGERLPTLDRAKHRETG